MSIKQDLHNGVQVASVAEVLQTNWLSTLLIEITDFT